MIIPPIPADEQARLQALYALNMLDTPAEERFDRITRTAARLMNVPMATLSLIDADRQWHKSMWGLSQGETSRDLSFCAHAIVTGDMLVVPDLRFDERFADHPHV